MTNKVEACVVRIFDPTDDIAGAGFLVSERHVLTCAHVVERALDLGLIGPEMPEAELCLDFPLVARGNILAARPIFWKALNGMAWPGQDGVADMAVLELMTEPPGGTHPCRLVTATDLWGHRFRSFGFPPLRNDGVWATGVLTGRQGSGWVQIEGVRETGYRVDRGFSGAPVWDETLDGVAGMAVAVDEQSDTRAAYVIPADALVRGWPTLREQAIPASPYRGLFAFREKDAPFFFGREAVTETLVEAVRKQPLVAVLGASGSGKSSTVFAGLVPRLRSEGTWTVASFRPGSRPFQSLAAGLIPLLEPQMSQTDQMLEAKKLAQALRQGTLTLADVGQRALETTGVAHLLLVVDQFEELYTLVDGFEDRTRFLDLLLAISRGGDVTPVFTLRADFLGHALRYRPFADALQDACLMLGPMNRTELQEVVERPAQVCGVEIEDGLTTRILDAVGEEPGNLPLLEFTLSLLWDHQEQRLLKHAMYEETGGVERALATYAEEVYGKLSDEEKRRAQRVFVQLVHPGEGTHDTRRVAVRDEVGDENWGLVAHLAGARLVVTARQQPTCVEIVEIVHEALIARWGRLREWMEADRSLRLWQERLRSALRQWEAAGRDDGALLRGIALTEATGWATGRGDDLGSAEAEFIQTSIAAMEEAEREKEAARRRELMHAQALAAEQKQRAQAERQRAEQQAKYAKLRGRQAKGLAAALAMAVLLAGFAWHERDRSERRRFVAIEKGLTAQVGVRLGRKQDDLAALLARQAYNLSHQVREAGAANADEALRRALAVSNFSRVRQGHENAVESVSFRSDGKMLASGSDDRTVRLWDVSHPERDPTVLEGHEDAVLSVAFSPDGRRLASGSVDNTVRLWDVSHPERDPTVLEGHEEAVLSVAFSPDGTRLASGADDSTVRLWDLAHPDVAPTVLRGHAAAVNAVAFSRDGRTFASGGYDNTVRLWDLSRPGSAPTVLKGVEHTVQSLAFSPDGRTLACGSDDNAVLLWDLGHPTALPVTLAGHEDFVASVAFSPDGKMLVSGSDDKTIRLWDLVHRDAAPTVLEGHEAALESVAFSPDGRTLASGGSDNTVRLWDLGPPAAPPVTLEGHEDSVISVAFSPNGKMLASGSDDSTVRLWDVTRPDLGPKVLMGHEGAVLSVAFSPDGRTLASGSLDNTVRLWDPDHPLVAPAVLKGHGDSVTSVAFSPDGRTLASGSLDNTVRLWDLDRPLVAPAMLKGHGDSVTSVAFSPDGRTLASGSLDNTVRLWNLDRPVAARVVLKGHKGDVTSVAFSPDGRTLASGSLDNTVRLWDLDRPLVAPAMLKGHGDSVTSVAFSPDGRTLASGSLDNTVRLWDLDRPVAARVVLKGHKGDVASVAFSPDGRTVASGSADDTVRLWDLDHPLVAPAVLKGHGADVTSVAFSPDGRTLASGSYDQAILLVPTTRALADMVCARSLRNLSRDEWNESVSRDIPYQRTCPQLPPGRDVQG